jgi:glutamate-ammonia-ligase adenylyltransferase
MSKNLPPPQRQNTTFPEESQSDVFSRHKLTPQLAEGAASKAISTADTLIYQELRHEIKSIKDKQDYFDALRLFKRKQHRKIQELETEPFKNREAILRKLTDVADAIAREAFEYTQNQMESAHGKPSYVSSYKQISPSELAIIGMGKFGAREMNYESDLDLVFIFSHIGEITGATPMSNGEYFSKFVRKLINLLSLTTGAGRCYDIDVELRPSGNAGPLVSSFDHFLDHQMNHALEWERIALLRARLVLAPENFRIPLEKYLHELAYSRPLPKDFFATMHNVRQRVLEENVRETPNYVNLKIGPGGLMDVEFILQGLQLRHQVVFPALRKAGLFDILKTLGECGLMAISDLITLSKAHLLYRTVESRLQLMRKRAENLIHFDSEDFSEIASGLNFANKIELKNEILSSRQFVLGLYQRIYNAS